MENRFFMEGLLSSARASVRNMQSCFFIPYVYRFLQSNAGETKTRGRATQDDLNKSPRDREREQAGEDGANSQKSGGVTKKRSAGL